MNNELNERLRKIDIERLDQYRKVLSGDFQFLLKENSPLELLHTLSSLLAYRMQILGDSSIVWGCDIFLLSLSQEK